mmetsp:Transcript_40806/g.97275  ORF Transcript_40806/g.97275 Transcript_40806/m.97275 type:complete len:231 (+) Transcript_40806:592-1284(+)
MTSGRLHELSFLFDYIVVARFGPDFCCHRREVVDMLKLHKVLCVLQDVDAISFCWQQCNARKNSSLTTLSLAVSRDLKAVRKLPTQGTTSTQLKKEVLQNRTGSAFDAQEPYLHAVPGGPVDGLGETWCHQNDVAGIILTKTVPGLDRRPVDVGQKQRSQHVRPGCPPLDAVFAQKKLLCCAVPAQTLQVVAPLTKVLLHRRWMSFGDTLHEMFQGIPPRHAICGKWVRA